MKYLIKPLSLLLAGLLAVSLLIACDSDHASGGADAPAGQTTKDTAEKPGEPDKSFDEYKNLTPQGVYDALLKAEDFFFATVMVRNVTGAEITMNYQVEKDGNIIRLTMSQDALDASYDITTVMYCDLTDGLYITESEGKWIAAKQEEGISLADLLADCAPTDLLFADENYQTSESGSFQLLPDAILKSIGSTTATVSGEMTVDDTLYTVLLTTAEAGNSIEMITQAKFVEVSLTLPEYEMSSSQSGFVETDPPEKSPNAP